MNELKRRIINKDKDLLQEYFRQAERLIRKNKKEEEIETVQTLIFISQVADYILEECE
jgi:vacuolar-type H+-ATPase subunit E/Vma4